MYDHQKEWVPTQMERLKQLHQDFLAKYNDAQYAQIEGVFECTIRSQSVTMTIDLDGTEISQAVIELISDKLDEIEGRIKHHQVNFISELNESTPLAKQAAATAAPAQKGPGRPRKAAAPSPQTMEAVGALAAQVPMNGSTANAAARATGSMPQG